MSDLKKLALDYHRKLHGKIQIALKKKIRGKRELGLAYTPGVAKPCLEISKDPRKAYDYCWKANTILIVTDGTAVLGLGDIGPEAALPVMEGKSVLFKMFGGVDCVPICLATKDPKEIIEIVTKIAPAYGGINLEDISAPRCFEIESELKKRLPEIPIFHDDQHGTAIVSLAGLINAAKVVRKNVEDLKVVFNGAGAAGVACAKLFLKYGVRDVVMCDRAGAIYEGRHENMNPFKVELARLTNRSKTKGSLADAMKGADVFVGVSAKDAVNPKMVQSMADRAIVFAMANPDPEILPDAAKKAGAAVIATGRSDFPNQINNVLAFPGIFRGALDCRCWITEKVKMEAALAIARCVPNPSANKIVPSALDKTVAKKVAAAVHRVATKI
ncbi:MAG: NADP-dependent malic enzyme [Patescibacteria group bacterium]